MKTIVNKIQLAKANDVTLLLDTNTNKLMEVEYVKSLIGLDGSVNHIFTNNGKDVVVPQDSNIIRMYAGKQQFEKELQIENTGLFLDGAKTEGHYRFVSHEDGRDMVGITSISFVNGVPVEVDAPIKGFEAIIQRGYISVAPIYEDVNVEEFYEDVDSATTFHDYVVTNKEGKEEVVKGHCSFIMPTDEQKPIVEELRAAIEKAQAAGIGLMLDTAYGKLHVYNAKKAYIEYDGGDCGASLTRLKLPESIKLPNPIYDYNDDSYYQIYERNVQE